MNLSEGLVTPVPSVSSGHSSSYYSSLMSQYSTLKSTFCEYDTLTEYANVIENAINALKNIKSNCSNARSSYASGGYISQGKRLDQFAELGDLDKCNEYLDNAINSLNLTKQKTTEAANNYKTKYNTCVNNLETAKRYYQRAKEQEAKAAQI